MQQHHDLLRHIVRFGVERSERELAQLAATAERLGVAGAIAGILVDETAPSIVRERAAARTVVAIDAAPRRATQFVVAA